MDEQTTIDSGSLPGTSAISLSTLLPVLGLVAGCVTYSYLRRTTSVLPFVMHDSSTGLLHNRSAAIETIEVRHSTRPPVRGYRQRLGVLCARVWAWLLSFTEGSPYSPIIDVENPDWEQNEPNAEGWRHSSFDWEQAPRFPRGSEDSEFERLWAPRDELSPLQRARLGLDETAGTSDPARATSSASTATGASGANGTNGSAQPASSQRPAIGPRQPLRSASTISNNGSVQSSASSQLEPVHLIDWSLNGFGL